VGIINQGVLVADGTLDELRSRASGDSRDATLEDVFMNVIGAQDENHNLSWLE
jgi:ABC-2 type transport system ATP-binding protein